jgi:DeoR/GlpR family transcriptional regulator of sugar metabolism
MIQGNLSEPIYPAERRRRIVEELRRQETLAVRDLAERFGVSLSTIRRDLDVLERAGLLERTYGAASAPLLGAQERPFSERRVTRAQAKRRIACAAAALIEPGDTLFLDGGTTVECLVPFLREMTGLTVVTLGLNLISGLAGCEGVTVIAIGGVLDHRTYTLGGTLAHELFRAQGMRFDRAFLAASGVSAAGGVTNASLDEIPLKRIAIDSARQKILLVDGAKVGRDAVAQVAPVARIDLLITDDAAPAEELERLRQRNVRIILA